MFTCSYICAGRTRERYRVSLVAWKEKYIDTFNKFCATLRISPFPFPLYPLPCLPHLPEWRIRVGNARPSPQVCLSGSGEVVVVVVAHVLLRGGAIYQ